VLFPEPEEGRYAGTGGAAPAICSPEGSGTTPKNLFRKFTVPFQKLNLQYFSEKLQ